MDFITNFFAPYKETLMSPITLCIIIALLGVIGYFFLMGDNQKVVQKEEFIAPAMNEQPQMDHIMEHGADAVEHQEAPQEDIVHEENAVAYDPSDSQHVEA